jgi:hypothetical protein
MAGTCRGGPKFALWVAVATYNKHNDDITAVCVLLPQVGSFEEVLMVASEGGTT